MLWGTFAAGRGAATALKPPVHDDYFHRRRNLTACLGEGVAFGVMVGIGEAYLAAFVLAVGLTEITAGLVASLPLLGGGFMQLISPTAVRLLRSHKKWVLICATAYARVLHPAMV